MVKAVGVSHQQPAYVTEETRAWHEGLDDEQHGQRESPGGYIITCDQKVGVDAERVYRFYAEEEEDPDAISLSACQL